MSHRSKCDVFWGSHGCNRKKGTHQYHRCICGMVVDSSGNPVKGTRHVWELFVQGKELPPDERV